VVNCLFFAIAKNLIATSESLPMSRRTKHHSAQPDPSSEAGTQRTVLLGELASEHRPGLLPEKRFRWRSGEVTRIEAFCDVVFGFALTLLVVSLEVPHSYGELIADMRGFVPFAICFSQLVMIWHTHYKFSRRYGLEDGYTIFLSMVMLFLVLLYVYPLKFVFSLVFSELTGGDLGRGVGWHEASVLMRIYAVGFTSVFLIFALLYRHAYGLRKELGLDSVEVHETRNSIESCLIMAGVGLASFAIAFRNPAWAGWSYLLIGPLLTIHGKLAGRRLSRLQAESAR
jgi:transmembrane protein TMEM174 (potassium channel)